MSDSPHRQIGDSELFARVPFPGYPEGIAVRDGLVFVAGPAAFGVPGNAVPSRIFVYSLDTGQFNRELLVRNESNLPHAVSCVAPGHGDDLYVIDEELGVVRVHISSGRQEPYAAPFSKVFTSQFGPPVPSLLNDLAFDRAGNLYVTDSFQATIWRVAPGGGEPRVWFQSAAIDGPFGPNGVRVDRESRHVYFTVSFDVSGRGVVYRLPLVDRPAASDLSTFHAYAAGAGPDGIAFGRSGKLYVALAGAQGISVLSTDGVEDRRLAGPARDPIGQNPAVAWTNPANLAFDDARRRLLVTNHAHLVPPGEAESLFAVFDVFVDDEGEPLFTP